MVKTQTAENFSLKTISGVECAWDRCEKRFTGEMPVGWANLLVWWSALPAPWRTIGEVASGSDCKRDAVLCPKHVAELETLLKDIGGALRKPLGSA
jgi:hypothetical protein